MSQLEVSVVKRFEKYSFFYGEQVSLSGTLRELIFVGTNFCGFFSRESSRDKRELIYADQMCIEILWELI